jgi:hypothetical protein
MNFNTQQGLHMNTAAKELNTQKTANNNRKTLHTTDNTSHYPEMEG